MESNQRGPGDPPNFALPSVDKPTNQRGISQ